jgi:hypothetical protein
MTPPPSHPQGDEDTDGDSSLDSKFRALLIAYGVRDDEQLQKMGLQPLSLAEAARQCVALYRQQLEAELHKREAAARVDEVERLVDVGGEPLQVRAWANRYRTDRLAQLQQPKQEKR